MPSIPSGGRDAGLTPSASPAVAPLQAPSVITPPPLRVGLIGCGYWGAKLARNFHALPEARLVALADLDPLRREHAARHYPDARVVDDHRQLLGSDTDALVIATPPSTHAALAIEALEAGKHVLVEKPLATSVEAADAIIAAAARAGRTLMVGHTFVYNPAVELLRQLVQSGELGRVYYIHATRVNLGICQSDINVLWDLAPHDLSILIMTLGAAPTGVRAHGHAYLRPGIEDVAWLTLDFPDGSLAHVHASWLDPCKIRRVTVVGDRKMAVYDDLAPLDKITVYDRGIDVPPYTDTFGEFQLSYRYGDVHSPRLDWVEPLKRECAHFVACARDGGQPRSSGCEGREVVAILEAADRSLHADGARVALT
jgi:predicted dehydrogenase